MLDFLIVSTRSRKRGEIEIYPKFVVGKTTDLMIRGGDFYAIWVEERGLWSKDENDAVKLIDIELDSFAEKNRSKYGEDHVRVLHLWDSETGMIDYFHRYCQRHMRDTFHALDEKLIFSNDKTEKKDYASKKLAYPFQLGPIDAYDRLMSVLYSAEERKKIEWSIGSIVSGESKTLQKFVVLYGSAGTGKSTILNIIQLLFDGYYATFDAKSLGSSNNAFALESFSSNPLVGIQHDGDLSRIEDNTRLNSLVSHEQMTVNEKHKSLYSSKFNTFLFMGTNKPVKITDAKSGLLRRLIDVSPTGQKVPMKEYLKLMHQIRFELGAIAYHCREVYLSDPNAYDTYIPTAMLGASNDFYNFVLDSYSVFKRDNSVTAKSAWEMYKEYCDEAKVAYPYPQRAFKEELKNYFHDYEERHKMDDGTRVRSYYSGFISDKFEEVIADDESEKKVEETLPAGWLIFDSEDSIFDKDYKDCPAQLASDDGTPNYKWINVTTTLSNLNTHEVHYVKPPENHIVIDFDIPDNSGNKCLQKNIEAANKWPPTYAELSKSGAGIHLHYIYDGDVSKLSHVYDDHIEIKKFTGGSSLRRKLSKCNRLYISQITSGLPIKEVKMVNFAAVKNENKLKELIKRNLNKEIHPGTKPSIDFIDKILSDAYESGMKYDVSDMRRAIISFAAKSTHHSDYCLKLTANMKFKSDEPSDSVNTDEGALIFFDCEVFPNLFLINWKAAGDDMPVVRMINPTPEAVEELMHHRLVGFNCRKYDNHILYARAYKHYTNIQIYDLSQKLVSEMEEKKKPYFSEAFNVSYTDVYDFSSEKKSLKKFEIELGIHHQELGLPWDQPVPENLWLKVAEYCDNDVLATEAVFYARKSDFTARQILADVAGKTVNDTTNSLTTKIIFGDNRKPQNVFNYRDMGCEKDIYWRRTHFESMHSEFDTLDNEYTAFDKDFRPIFPGYIYAFGKSSYRGEDPKEGGYVYAEPGMYSNVALLDIASMHPSSIVAENLFGDEYTARFREILEARIAIKHGEFERAKTMLDGKLAKYLDDPETAKDLAQALKIAINSVYGLTKAGFDNPFRDKRNLDNIVAKRGALFMINLKHEVQNRGFTVAHIKTDSIKIPNATPEIIEFVMRYGKLYGYNFEHEETYDRMCLVNDAVYIAKYKEPHKDKKTGKDIWWTATGTQFSVPYVFKKLFSHDDILFKDLCETKSVSKGSIYIDMNEDLPDVSRQEAEFEKARKKYRDGKLSDITMTDISNKLIPQIEAGHNYVFIGRVGLFCPIKPGFGGGVLYRKQDEKYYAVTGTSGYRWLESEVVGKSPTLEENIDESYYISLVDAAIETINKFGDFERFVSGDPLPDYRALGQYMNIPEDSPEEIPFIA